MPVVTIDVFFNTDLCNSLKLFLYSSKTLYDLSLIDVLKLLLCANRKKRDSMVQCCEQLVTQLRIIFPKRDMLFTLKHALN